MTTRGSSDDSSTPHHTSVATDDNVSGGVSDDSPEGNENFSITSDLDLNLDPITKPKPVRRKRKPKKVSTKASNTRDDTHTKSVITYPQTPTVTFV